MHQRNLSDKTGRGGDVSRFSYGTRFGTYLGRRVRYLKHGRHVDQGLADLAVCAPDEAEGDGQLEEEAVDKHEVADRGGPGGWLKQYGRQDA